MFITLTQIDTQFNTSPVLVNTANITYCYTQTRTLTHRYDRATQTTTKLDPFETRTTTSICFTAGLNDEADSIWVTETLSEIARMAS